VWYAGGILPGPHIGLVAEKGPEAIIPLNKPGSFTVNAPITINGATGERGNLSAILSEHAREIARQVQQVLSIQYKQEAVV
jgi:hypothetical protein